MTFSFDIVSFLLGAGLLTLSDFIASIVVRCIKRKQISKKLSQLGVPVPLGTVNALEYLKGVENHDSND